MRVALCLSGAPRLEPECLASQALSLGKTHGFDVFAYVWSGWGQSDEETAKEISKQLAPAAKTTNIHVAKEYLHGGAMPDRILPEANPANIFKMYYAIMKADELRRQHEAENGFSYDLVIRSRTDIRLSHAFSTERIAEGLNENSVILPKNGHHRGGFNDRFAIGKSSAMTKYASVFCYIYSHLNAGIPLHAETILKTHLSYMGVSAEILDFFSIIVKDGVPRIHRHGDMIDCW